MQCAQCGSPIEAKSGQAPASCPKCGAPVSAPAKRGGGSWTTVLVLLLVALLAVSAGSIMFAMQAVKERDRAIADYAASAGAFDEIIASAASSGRLKGPAAMTARQEVFTPAINYYQDFAKKYESDEKMLPEVVSAKLHLAALQAKTGSPECVTTLRSGVKSLSEMSKTDFPADSYPGFQAIVLRIAEPTDWMMVKTDNQMAHGGQLFLAIDSAAGTYQELVKKFPQSVPLRDDLTALLGAEAGLLTLIGRPGHALVRLNNARDVLESLVREAPDNEVFKDRLAEVLENGGRIQKQAKMVDEATASYKRAVEVRQQLADAKPDDKTLKQKLTSAQESLASMANVKPDPKPEEAPPAEEAPAAETAKEEAAPAKEPAAAAEGAEAPATP